MAQSGASIVTSVFRPKLAGFRQNFADGCRGGKECVRRHAAVAHGGPWDVLAGAPEYEGLGYSRLATEITKTSLRLFRSMCASRFASENDLGRAMTHLTQRLCGTSTPVNMLHANDPRLLLPLDGSAPRAVHMFHELRSLGCSLAIGWRCEPPACNDATIHGVMLDTAGGDDAGLSDDQLASSQKWRRAARAMWVSELLQADGRTLLASGLSSTTSCCVGCKPSRSRRCACAL